MSVRLAMQRPALRAVVFFNLVVLAFLPFGLELVLRWTEPLRGLPIEGFYNDYFYTWGKLVYVNRLGFRERDFSETKAANAYRIMLLGDSYTYGVGLTDVERYGNLLEQQLQSHWPEREVQVLNFGVSASCTVDQRDLLKKHMPGVRPDRIIVGFCYNDPKPGRQEDSAQRAAFERRFPLGAIATNLGQRLNLPRTGEFIKTRIDNLAGTLGLFPKWPAAVAAAYAANSPEWRDFVLALENMKAMSDAADLPPPIFASLTNYKDPAVASQQKRELYAQFQQWHRQAEAAARAAGWVVVDFEKEIPPDAPDSWLVVNRVDAHPSPAMNQIYAMKLFETLTGQMPPARVDATSPAASSRPETE